MRVRKTGQELSLTGYTLLKVEKIYASIEYCHVSLKTSFKPYFLLHS